MFFKHFASKNQLLDLSINGTLVENGLREKFSFSLYELHITYTDTIQIFQYTIQGCEILWKHGVITPWWKEIKIWISSLLIRQTVRFKKKKLTASWNFSGLNLSHFLFAGDWNKFNPDVVDVKWCSCNLFNSCLYSTHRSISRKYVIVVLKDITMFWLV